MKGYRTHNVESIGIKLPICTLVLLARPSIHLHAGMKIPAGISYQHAGELRVWVLLARLYVPVVSCINMNK